MIFKKSKGQRIDRLFEIVAELGVAIEGVNTRVAEKFGPKDIIKCDKCKSLICACDAVRGEKEVRTRKVMRGFYGYESDEDYIYMPKYCKNCAPKTPKPKPAKKKGKK